MKLLQEILKKIEPSKEELNLIENSLEEFKLKLLKKIGKKDIEIFIGGSFAKKTLVKKDSYDVDIFLRFNKKYKDISKITEKLLKDFKNVKKIHGSRDYFKIKMSPEIFFEVIPVIKVKNPKNSLNITDLSYSHVRYINKKIKNKKLLEDIKLAKAFCYATKTYGAESYIKGFSGYSLELMVFYYGGFLKFIKTIAKHKKGKIIIDLEKYYRGQNVLLDLNSSKLESPIILIDPTYKQRNALAALSEETFEKFKKACRKFLKKPSIKDFEIKRLNLEKIKKEALSKKYEFILLEASTSKQEGDIAGTKLLKFYNHLTKEIREYFNIKKRGFNYNNKKNARYFFIIKKKKEIILEGPFLKDEKNVKLFKKEHKKTFKKEGRIYSKKIIDFNINEFIINWKIKYKKKLKEMSIRELKIL